MCGGFASCGDCDMCDVICLGGECAERVTTMMVWEARCVSIWVVYVVHALGLV